MFEEILFEKLAAKFSDEELNDLMKEAAREAGAANGSEASVEKLAEMLSEDEMAELINEVEAEKTAAAYYEFGKVMAQGFKDELEKLSAENEMPPEMLEKMKAKKDGEKEDKKEDKKEDSKEDEKEEDKEEEKKSSDAEIYRALATLSEAGLLEKDAALPIPSKGRIKGLSPKGKAALALGMMGAGAAGVAAMRGKKKEDKK